MTGRILVGLGGSPFADGPLQTAIDLARRHGAMLTGVTVANLDHARRIGPVPIGAGAVANELRDHRVLETRRHVEAAVQHFTSACERACVEAHVLREERSEPFDYLISQARYHDVTVLGLKGLFEYGVAGEREYDPAEALIYLVNGGVRPLIAVGPETHDIHRVMIAYSGSVGSAKTMKRFVEMRLWPEAHVRIVAFGSDIERRERHLHHAAEYCKAHNMDVETHLESGDPRFGVLEAADSWDADLIVMGNSHHTLITRKMLGDTLLETLKHTDTPLFLAQ